MALEAEELELPDFLNNSSEEEIPMSVEYPS